MMLCITPAHNGSVCSLRSGWATTTGRLLGPKGYKDALSHQESEPMFRNLSITSPVPYQLSNAATFFMYSSVDPLRLTCNFYNSQEILF